MGNRKFSNRAASSLSAGILAGDTSLTVASGQGARFPALSAGQSFTAVLQAGDQDTDAREYILVTARSGDTLTITRAQEGSAAAAWSAGMTIAMVVTAANLASFLQSDGDTLTGALNFAPRADIASAATMDLSTVSSNSLRVTGTTTVSSLGTLPIGSRRLLHIVSGLTFTQSSSLQLPGLLNLVAGAGDMIEFESIASGTWKCINYQPVANLAVNQFLTNSVDGSLMVTTGFTNLPQSVGPVSGTLTIDASKSNIFRCSTLSANVTSVVINNAQDGQTINIRFVQDATGGRTITGITGSSSFKLDGSPTTLANRVSVAMMTWNSAASRWEGSWLVVPA